jgi:hypothetical protein
MFSNPPFDFSRLRESTQIISIRAVEFILTNEAVVGDVFL